MAERRLTIMSWNVNGVRAAERKGFLGWLAQCGADVVAVQETKAAPEQLSAALRSPVGYHAEWCAAEQRGYSGVATFSRAPALEVGRGLGDPRFDNDGRVLVTRFPELVLFNIYFPNGGRGPEWVEHKLAFYARFVQVVTELMAAGERVVVAGDVNTAFAEIDIARPKENSKVSGFLPEERAAMAEFYAAGLVDTFRHLRPGEVKYSWWASWGGARERNVGWRLDYIFVSPNLLDAVVDADILCDVPGSDHCPVTLTLALR
ncbi:MAG TPA: exodeoxyribonuclease III [Roseiflexaceae bacterium]|nr:exodeoxyribonuclease III [Roseiflexaceae bacterium]